MSTVTRERSPSGYEGYDGVALAALIATGQLRAEELLEQVFDRLHALDHQIGAVSVLWCDDARATLRREGSRRGPFAGVPLLLKDWMGEDIGHPYTGGMRVLREAGWRGDRESGVARRFARAGFITFGRTKVPEQALTGTTEPFDGGPSRNPWSLEHSSGGSSGGAAAAVAARIVPIAHGNDALGSIRIPASACGLLGLKPSRGRVSLAPGPESIAGMAVEGVLTRTVRDTAACLDVLSGSEAGDPWPAPSEVLPFAQTDDVSIGPLRIGVLDLLAMGIEAAPECAAATAASGALLEARGHQLFELPHPDARPTSIYTALMTRMAAGVALQLQAWERRLGHEIAVHELEPLTGALRTHAQTLSAADLAAAIGEMQLYGRRLGALWNHCDLLLTPTLPWPPPRLGTLIDPDDLLGSYRRALAMFDLTVPWNITGQPAISIPAHRSQQGLPIGVQLVGPHWSERRLLSVAEQLQQATRFHEWVPPLCVTS
jgi:amidase